MPLEPTVLIEINVRVWGTVIWFEDPPVSPGTRSMEVKFSCPTPFKYLGRFNMPLYMYQGAYTSQSWAAQVKNPQNRIETIGRQSCEAVGGKLVGAWYCFGDFRFRSDRGCPEQREYDVHFVSCSCRGRYQKQSNDSTNDGRSDRGGHEEGSVCCEGLPTGYVSVPA